MKTIFAHWAPAVAAVGLSLGLTAIQHPPAAPAPPAPARIMAAPVAQVPLEQAMAARINQLRLARGLRPLTLAAPLVAAARAHAVAMGTQDFYGHAGPDGDPLSRMLASPFPATHGWGEIIWVYYRDPALIGAMLAQSPRTNWVLFKPEVTHFGVAAVTVPGSRWGLYWTVDMGASPTLRRSVR